MEMERENTTEQEHVQEGEVNNHGNALHTESDLIDHVDVAVAVEDLLAESDEDYSHYSKEQFADLIKEISKDDNFKRADTIIKKIKPLFDDIRGKERAEALTRFVADGGTAEDFEYKGDEFDIIFDANLKLIRDRKNQFIKQLEEKKSENLKKKEHLLESLRVLSDSNDTNNQFDKFKELQREWKSIGPVPGPEAKTLWANYHALLDRFYDNQSIYFELKELDRRRNLEAKIELCIRAEKLVDVENINDAIRELNELHHEFKHLGPVPIEDKEAVWKRFKTASDTVYAKRDAFVHTLQQELHVNMEHKLKLSEEVQVFATYTSDRIKEWNLKSKEVLDLQKRWEAIGGIPRSKAKEVNKKFWTAFKLFFNNKNIFFKKLDEERDHNLLLKNELVKRASELKESQEWDKASNELKGLQQKWKDIGPVPEKMRDRVFKEFKDSCDHFFEQMRLQKGKAENEQVENLKLKEAVCAEFEGHIAAGTAAPDILHTLQNKFNSIGFVPRNNINAIRERHQKAVDTFIRSISSLNEEEKSKLVLTNELSDLRNDPMAEQKIYHREQAIRKKISKVENDIAVWNNNLEFFGKSKNADKMKEEFQDKLKEAADHLKQLKDQLKLLRTV